MNFLSLEGDEKITSILPMPKEVKASDGLSLLLATKNGTVKKTSAAAFKEVRRSGLIAIGLDKGDSLISASFVRKGDTVFLVTSKGQSIRFDEKDVREMGRQAAGVRGIKLGSSDAIVGAGIAQKGGSEELLVLSQLGYGKKTPIKEYKVQGRGGSGIKTSAVTAKTGPVIAGLIVGEHGELIAMSQKSQVIRTDLNEIRSSGRQTQGVRVMTLRQGDKIAACVVLEGKEE
jgi:DNA gyrase subunit A